MLTPPVANSPPHGCLPPCYLSPPRCLPPCPGSDLAVCLAHTVPLHCPHTGPPTAISADSILSSYSEELVHPFLLLLFSCPALLQYSYTPGIATQHSEQTKHIQTKDDHTNIHVPLLLVYLVSPPTHTHTCPHHTYAGHAYYTTSSVLMPNTLSLRPTTSSW